MFSNIFLEFFVFFCLLIVNQSNYVNKTASEVAKFVITRTHSDISRGHSPLGILGKVYLKSEWRSSWILLIHRPERFPSWHTLQIERV